MKVEESRYGSTWMEIDPSGGEQRSGYRDISRTIRLGVGKDGELFSVTIGNKTQKALLAGTLRGLERYLFVLQAGTSKVELDRGVGNHEFEYCLSD